MDSLTQLQDWLDFIAERFYLSAGVLQRDAPPVPDGQSLPPAVSEQISSFSKEIVYVSRVLDAIISQLPRTKFSETEHALERSQLETLVRDNELAGDKLRASLQKAEQKLALVRAALQEIAEDRLADIHNPPPC